MLSGSSGAEASTSMEYGTKKPKRGSAKGRSPPVSTPRSGSGVLSRDQTDDFMTNEYKLKLCPIRCDHDCGKRHQPPALRLRGPARDRPCDDTARAHLAAAPTSPAPCSSSHDWRTCPGAHPGENAARRDHAVVKYLSVCCPESKAVGGGPPGRGRRRNHCRRRGRVCSSSRQPLGACVGELTCGLRPAVLTLVDMDPAAVCWCAQPCPDPPDCPPMRTGCRCADTALVPRPRPPRSAACAPAGRSAPLLTA